MSTFACEICGEEYTSLRAAFICEEHDLNEDRGTRRHMNVQGMQARH